MLNHLCAGLCTWVITSMAVVSGVCQSPAGAAEMYWGDLSTGVIWYASTNGDNLHAVLNTGSIRGVAIDEQVGKLYWADTMVDPGVYRSNLDGTDAGPVIITDDLYGHKPFGVAVDSINEKVYWSTSAGPSVNGIYRSNLDGSGFVHLVDQNDFEFDSTWGLFVVPERNELYWTTQIGLARSDLNGGNVQTILTGSLENPVRDIAVDPISEKIYIAEANRISRANLDGSGLETIVTHTDYGNPTGLDVHAGMLYWTQPTSNGSLARVRRSNLDGSNVVTLISMPNGGFTSIVVIPEPSSLALLGLSGLMFLRRHTTGGALK